MQMSVEVEIKGNLSKLGPEQARQAVEGTVREIVEMGEGRLNEMLRPRPAGVYLAIADAQKGKGSTGHYRRNLQTKVQSMNALITDGGVIYGPWLEGISSRNDTTRFKGYASFRRTAQWMQEQVNKVLQAYVKRAIDRLNQ